MYTEKSKNSIIKSVLYYDEQNFQAIVQKKKNVFRTSCPRKDSRSIPRCNPTCHFSPIRNRKHCIVMNCTGEQRWRSGESARLPPWTTMCPGFDSRTRHLTWVEFVVSSLLCSERFFSGYSGFPLFSNSILECTGISERVLVNSLVLRR